MPGSVRVPPRAISLSNQLGLVNNRLSRFLEFSRDMPVVLMIQSIIIKRTSNSYGIHYRIPPGTCQERNPRGETQRSIGVLIIRFETERTSALDYHNPPPIPPSIPTHLDPFKGPRHNMFGHKKDTQFVGETGGLMHKAHLITNVNESFFPLVVN